MDYFNKGSEREGTIRLLFDVIPKATSKKLKEAAIDYLVKGYSQKSAAIRNDVQQPHISAFVKRLDGLYGIYAQIRVIEREVKKVNTC